jgi:aromatic-L-amino-acid/L-tryptophan decarboxylase
MDRDQFRRSGHEFVDWIADYMDTVESLPVMSRVQPGEIQARLPADPPQAGESMDRIFSDFKSIIMPGITHWQHPGWHGYFPANNSPESVLAEFLTAGLGAQCMSWQTSPAAAELEDRVMDWLRGMLGLPAGLRGVIQDSASSATLCALISAREKATGFEANEKGLQRPLTVYVSRETHSSVEKGVKIAGYGRQNLRFVDTNATFAMLPEKLEEAIRRDAAAGLQPACVVATLGTTSSTAVDPLRAVGEIAARHGLWLHVDAAYAGTAALCPENRWMLDGAEYMDSFVFNPHKWMLTNFDCSAYFVKDPEYLVRAFEIHPEYLKTGRDSQVRNYRDWGIPLGRRFRALKLWFVIRSYGIEGLRSLVREHLRLAQMFAAWVESAPGFEILAPVRFGVVCFRMNDGRDEAGLAALNQKLLDQLNASGRVFLSHTVLGGRFTLRMVIGQRLTAERHVRSAWDLIRATAIALKAPAPPVRPAAEVRPAARAKNSVPAVSSTPAKKHPNGKPVSSPPISPPPPTPAKPPSSPAPVTAPPVPPTAPLPPAPAATPRVPPTAPLPSVPAAARPAPPTPPAFVSASRSKEAAPARRILAGQRLDLVACDLALVEMIINDKAALGAALNVSVPQDWPVSPEVQPLFRDMLKDNPFTSGWLGYAAILRAEKTLIGDAGFLGPPDDSGNVEIGYSVIAGRRGMGFASEMVALLIHWAFADDRVRRVVAHTDPDNQSSMKVLEKNGFQRVGSSAFLDQGDKIFWILERGSNRD